MESSTLTQLQSVLSDLQRDLEDVRKNRRELLSAVEDSHVIELEILIGIRDTKEFIEKITTEEGISEMEAVE